ncbi:MAG: UbiA-like polyprenyltransferase [bacterium]
MFKKISSFFVLIKFEHSIFALPFAYIGGLIGYKGIMPFYYWLFLTLACVFARTSAMVLNRLIDIEIDRQNPRTHDRFWIIEKIGMKWTIFALILSIFLFLLSSYKLNLTCFLLSPLALFLISSYPYTKRFTWASHLYLGICLACAPIGGCLATSENLNLPSLIIGLFVIFWVSGFDIIYSLLDLSFDKKHGLYSIPQRFGEKIGLKISLFFHLFCAFLLIPFGISSHFGLKYLIGALFIFIFLIKQHIIIKDRARINEAFFTTNGIISILFFLVVVLSYL